MCSRMQAPVARTSVALRLAPTVSLSRQRLCNSEMISERSGLPVEITGSGGRAFALITEKLKAKAQTKAAQLANHGMPTVLAITSDHAFASILMDNLAADYLMYFCASD